MIGAGLPMQRRAHLTGPLRHPCLEAATLTSGLQLTADSLLAFQRDLEARGVADRVLVHVWSEFGRRPQRTPPPGPTTAQPASVS